MQMIKTSFANLKLTQTKQIPLYSRIARRGCFSQCRLHFQQRIMGVSMQLIRHLLTVFEKTLIRLAMEYSNIQHLFSLFYIFKINKQHLKIFSRIWISGFAYIFTLHISFKILQIITLTWNGINCFLSETV